jgi:hypothetical protein
LLVVVFEKVLSRPIRQSSHVDSQHLGLEGNVYFGSTGRTAEAWPALASTVVAGALLAPGRAGQQVWTDAVGTGLTKTRELAFLGGRIEEIALITETGAIRIASAMTSTATVNFTLGSYLSPEALTGIGCSALPIIAAFSCTLGDSAIGSDVSRVARALEVAIDSDDFFELAHSLVEGAQVPTLEKIDKLGLRAVVPRETVVADASTEIAEPISITIFITGTEGQSRHW